MKKKGSIVSIIGASLLMSKTNTSAKEVSIGIYPPLTRIQSNYRAKVNAPISIFNNTDRVLVLNVEFKAFTSSGKSDGSISYASPKDTQKDMLDFLNTVKLIDSENEVKTITAFPKQYKTVSIQFVSPAKDNDYYFSVLFTPQNIVKSADDSIINLNASIGTNILLTVNKKNASGFINQLNTQSVIFGGPAKFKVLTENTSKNFITASGKIDIYDIFGNKGGSINLEPVIILGNSSRYMMVKEGSKQNTDITWNEKFLLGPYTAKATILLDKTVKITSETHFVSIPLIILLAGSIVLFVALSIAYKVVRKINFQE